MLLVNVLDSILDIRDLLPLYVQVDANTLNLLGVVLVQHLQAAPRSRQPPQLIALWPIFLPFCGSLLAEICSPVSITMGNQVKG